MRIDANNFRNLNRAGSWLGFELHAVEVRDDGALQLWSLPRQEEIPAPSTSQLPDPSQPAGIAVDTAGNIYAVEPGTQRVIRDDACTGDREPVVCVGGEGTGPGRFQGPGGLLAPPHRNALYVADSGNHRVQIFDLDTGQLMAVWGRTGNPTGGPGGFDTPWALAADPEGNVYVVDLGKRVQKFRPTGDVDPLFEREFRSHFPQAKPIGIAVASDLGEIFIYVLDGASNSVVAVDASGRARHDENGNAIRFGIPELQKPSALSADEDAVYIGDNGTRSVHVYKRGASHQHAGNAVGYDGPVAALALDGTGHLLVHTGASAELVRLKLHSGYRRRGAAWTSQGIQAGNVTTAWHRLKASLEKIGANGHLQLFVAQQKAAPPVHPDTSDPFPAPQWRSAPVDGDSIFVGGAPGPFIWIAVRLFGDGASTPAISQLRVEYDAQTYLEFLPDIYREQDCDDFLLRFLSLFESFFDEADEAVARLPAMFDPAAAPAEQLPWLASWLALELEEDWTEEMQRACIATAFERYGRRGTALGIRESLLKLTGVQAVIEEPILNASLWVLPRDDNCRETVDDCGFQPSQESSVLGWTTMLAPAEAQGAVVGTTAILDQSHLITNEEIGWPLFEDVAHQFSVRVYRRQIDCDKTEAAVRSVLERERPAHTDYHLCVIEPRMRLGFQSTLGIDTVVAGVAPTPLGEGDGEMILGGEPPGHVGRESRVGITTRL